MAYVIGNLSKIHENSYIKRMTLSCMEKDVKNIQQDLFNSECIQKRIEKAAEVRAKLEEETAKRDEKIKSINFFG